MVPGRHGEGFQHRRGETCAPPSRGFAVASKYLHCGAVWTVQSPRPHGPDLLVLWEPCCRPTGPDVRLHILRCRNTPHQWALCTSGNKVVITRPVMAKMLPSNSKSANFCVEGPAFLLCQPDERVKLPVGEEQKYSGYKIQIFVSGLLPSCAWPPPIWGPHRVHAATPAKADPPRLKGKAERRAGGGDTMRSLSLPHGCPSPPARKYHHSDLHSHRRQTLKVTVVLQ